MLVKTPDLLRLARFFTVVAEEGHFGHAADRLGISQPSLSQAVQRLERLLDVTLLHRGPRGVALSAAGAALLPAAQQLIAAEARLHQQAREQTALGHTLRLGVAAPVPAHLIASMAVSVEGQAPGSEIAVRTAPSSDLVDAVTAGHLDVAVIAWPALVGDLAAGVVVHLRTDLLLSPASTPPETQPTRLRELITRPLATTAREHGPAAHDLLVDTLNAHGVAAGTVTVADDRAALALVAADQACALTADPHLAAAGILRRAVPGDALPLRLRVIWKQSASSTRDQLGRRLTAALSSPQPGPPESASTG